MLSPIIVCVVTPFVLSFILPITFHFHLPYCLNPSLPNFSHMPHFRSRHKAILPHPSPRNTNMVEYVYDHRVVWQLGQHLPCSGCPSPCLSLLQCNTVPISIFLHDCAHSLSPAHSLPAHKSRLIERARKIALGGLQRCLPRRLRALPHCPQVVVSGSFALKKVVCTCSKTRKGRRTMRETSRTL